MSSEGNSEETTESAPNRNLWMGMMWGAVLALSIGAVVATLIGSVPPEVLHISTLSCIAGE